MSDSDGSNSCQNLIRELTQDESDDSVPRRMRIVTGGLSGWRAIRA